MRSSAVVCRPACLLLVGALALTGCETQRTGAEGVVVDENGDAIPGAQLALHDGVVRPSGKPRARAETDREGRFRISFEGECIVSGCLGGGLLVADADGYEAQFIELREQRGEQFYRDTQLTLRSYDELPVESSGIPDEQPRKVVSTTYETTLEASLSDSAGPWVPAVEEALGRCDAAEMRHGRDDEYRCATMDGVALSNCFAWSDEERPDLTVLCLPEGSGWQAPRVLLSFDAPLPQPDLTDPASDSVSVSTSEPAPRLVRFDAGPDASSRSCDFLSEPLLTQSGDAVGYRCSGTPTTWLLSEFERGERWTATRISAVEPPQAGVIQEWVRRRVDLSSVQF